MDFVIICIGSWLSGAENYAFNTISMEYKDRTIFRNFQNGHSWYQMKYPIFVLVTSLKATCSLLSNSSPKSKVKTSVLGLGVDFVFPLSQQQEQQQQQQPPPKSIRRGCTRSL